MSGGRVVVFRPGALGDTIVAADALAAIRAAFSDSIVELVGNAPAAALLHASGLVDIVTPFDALDVSALFEAEPLVADRWRDAELVVLWLHNAESIAAAFRGAGARRVAVAAPRSPRLYPEPPPPGEDRGTPVHISDFLLASLAEAATQPAARRPALLAPPAGVQPLPENTGLLHAGSGSPRKNWPADNFAEIARRLIEQRWQVRLLQGPADRESVSDVARTTGLPVEGPADLMELAALLATAALYVGNDSGVTHLSARLGRPTVAVFGPTDPEEWAPRGPCVAVLGGRGRWPTEGEVWEAVNNLRGIHPRHSAAPD